MKGPLAAMISAFVILKRLNFPLKGNLILNCVSDEEVLGEIGTKWCITNYPEKMRADAVIVCEPSGLDPLPKAILIGEKGRLEVQIITHGISYHAGMPALGVNAFEMFNKIFNNIHKLNSYISPVIPPFSKDELKSMLIECFGTKEIFEKIYEDNSILQALIDALSNFTCTLSIVKAGLKENVGPGECTAILDIRLVQGQDSKEIINGLKKLINDVGYPIKSPDSAAKNELYVELKINSLSEPSIVDRYDYEIIDILKNTYKEIYHKKTFKFLMPATTDARFFRNSGFCKQTVVFGPGNATQAHSKNEYIDIKDLINATKTYALVAARFLK